MEPHPSENEQITDKAYRYFNEMDFIGQNSAKNIILIVQILATIVGFAVGYVNNKFEYCVYIVLGASTLLCLFTVPSWPFLFRKNELKWLPAEIPADYELKKDQ